MIQQRRKRSEWPTVSVAKRLKEIGLFFQKRDPIYQTLKRLTKRLDTEGWSLSRNVPATSPDPFWDSLSVRAGVVVVFAAILFEAFDETLFGIAQAISPA